MAIRDRGDGFEPRYWPVRPGQDAEIKSETFSLASTSVRLLRHRFEPACGTFGGSDLYRSLQIALAAAMPKYA